MLEELIADHPVDARGTMRTGGGPVHAVLLCGGFHYEDPAIDPILCTQPPVLRIAAGRRLASHWLGLVVRFLAAESTGEHVGAAAVTSRLAEVSPAAYRRSRRPQPRGDRVGHAPANTRSR